MGMIKTRQDVVIRAWSKLRHTAEVVTLVLPPNSKRLGNPPDSAITGNPESIMAARRWPLAYRWSSRKPVPLNLAAHL